MDNVPSKVESRAITPAGEVAFATEAAKVLMDIVKKGKLSKKLGGDREHIMYEGWATVAKFYGCTIKAVSVNPIGPSDDKGKCPGYIAKAVIIDSTGREIGCAESACMRDENTWRNRQNYALMSMAQTRAGAKAARMVFSWVVVLAGYSPTPLEEMPDDENGKPTPEPPKPAKGLKEFLTTMADLKAEAGETIYYGVLQNYGFKHANQIKDRTIQVKVFRELNRCIDAMKDAEEVFAEQEPAATEESEERRDPPRVLANGSIRSGCGPLRHRQRAGVSPSRVTPRSRSRPSCRS